MSESLSESLFEQRFEKQVQVGCLSRLNERDIS